MGRPPVSVMARTGKVTRPDDSPHEAGLGAGVPTGAVRRRRPVEVGAGRQSLQQHDPGGRAVVAWPRFRDGKGRPQGVVIVGEDDFQRGRQVRPGDKVRRPPAEYIAKEMRQVEDRGDRVGGVGRLHILNVFAETLLEGEGVAIHMGLRVQQGERRHDKADRLKEAEPFEVSKKFRIFGHFVFILSQARDKQGRSARLAGP
jgi:hypothetical protein